VGPTDKAIDDPYAPSSTHGDERYGEVDDRPASPPVAEPRRSPVGYAPVAPSRTDHRPVAGAASRSGREHRGVTAPAWEEPRRHDSYPTLKARRGTAIPRPLAYALIVLVAGIALFTVPFLLNGLGGGDGDASPTPAASESAEPTAEPTVTPEPTPEEVVYVVKAGDTLSKIAAANGVTVDQILAANPDISNPNQISVGDRIIIPQALPSEIVDDAITPEP
jgi:LysM repeat protein